MLLPSADDAAAWLLETARAALAAGDRIDLDTVLVLRALAPRDPLVSQAIDRLDPEDDSVPASDLAARAQHLALAIRIAVDANDEGLGRQVVSDFEADLLRIHRPGQSLGSLDADVSIASLLLDIWDVGQQLPHQMMAEELMLVALRVHWRQRHDVPFRVRAEAARTLMRLHASTQKPEYRDHAVALLRDFNDTYRTHGLGAARYVLALQMIS